MRKVTKTEVRPEDYPTLRELVRGYLHEDFREEHGSAAAAAQAFLSDASPDERRALAGEAKELLRRAKGMSLEEITRLLVDRLGSGWAPETKKEALELFGGMTKGS